MGRMIERAARRFEATPRDVSACMSFQISPDRHSCLPPAGKITGINQLGQAAGPGYAPDPELLLCPFIR
jgi:hypothetical protein